MAIYKNREVSIVAPTRRINPPSTIQIQYQDGTYETVTTGQVKFTEDEKKALVKNFPSEFDGVDTVSEDDIKAVRVGVAPASDPDRRHQAEAKVQTDEARKIEEENRKQAEDQVKKDQSKSAKAPLTSPSQTQVKK